MNCAGPKGTATVVAANANAGDGQGPCLNGGAAAQAAASPRAWFGDMIDHCLAFARASRAAGHPIVGILCEYTPRELILAAGAVPICLCGGSEKTIPAAEEELPANLCPLIKSTYGYHVLKKNPFLEMADLVVAETTCDGKKKMYELMAETRPMYILELPQKEGDPAALDHWVSELAKFKAFLESRFGVTITREKLRDAIVLMNRERAWRRALAELMKAEAPPLTGRQLLDFKSSISGIPADLDQYQAAWEQLSAQTPLSRQAPATGRLAGAASPSTASRPVRVLLTGVPLVHGAERVMDLIEGHGGVVVCQENCTGLKPICEDVDSSEPDLVCALAKKYFQIPCSVKTPNARRGEWLRQWAVDYRAECVIELIWQACLTYDVESARIKRLVEGELALPYLRLQTDYSPSDSARIALRVEALFETVRHRL